MEFKWLVGTKEVYMDEETRVQRSSHGGGTVRGPPPSVLEPDRARLP